MMQTVFIGGSRYVRVLNDDVRAQLDLFIRDHLPILIGDADGADKAVQDYLHARAYPYVEVFCVNGRCRNNVGGWPSRAVSSPSRRKDYHYYAAKDRFMAREAARGLMIWDGRSAGTLANVGRMARQGKPVTVYLAATGRSVRLANAEEWERFLGECPPAVRARVEENLRAEENEPLNRPEPTLF
jgi:adenine-specific DNA-methyltransferase